MSDPMRKVRLVAEEEALKLGASFRFEEGKKHTKLYIGLGGEETVITLSRASNNNRRNHREDWVRQDIRKTFKALQCNISKRS